MSKNVGKVLVSIGSLWYGVMPVIADLNESHLLNPAWMPRQTSSGLAVGDELLSNYVFAVFDMVSLSGAGSRLLGCA